MKALACAVAALVFASGCSPTPSSTESPFPAPILRATAGTPDGVYGIANRDSTLDLYVLDGQTARRLTSIQESGNRPTVHLLGYGGETGSVYNSFVFGLAPEGAVRFRLAPGASGIGGDVVEGTFLVALMKRDVSPDELHWAFLATDGKVVAEGTGIRD